ncbi:MAG: cyclic pyranopterin monophosphate synthase MoaC [Spirochaetales bacterium]
MSSHINESGTPRMVDVGAKSSTLRRATAEGRVYLPVALDKDPTSREWWSPKGPVFQTAIIAGVQGAKATASTIPLCHPLPITRCDVSVEPVEMERETGSQILVRCTVETDAKTGVEMEALCGVSAACLTVYDMGKSVTHGITIGSIELVEKTGGKRDWHRDETGNHQPEGS